MNCSSCEATFMPRTRKDHTCDPCIRDRAARQEAAKAADRARRALERHKASKTNATTPPTNPRVQSC